MPNRKNDYLTEAGAKTLAARIEKFWKDAGYSTVMTAVVPAARIRDGGVWAIQSNIGISGPPR
jgi:hypothetical protein